MTLANIAYLVLVLAAYALFMVVLGGYWLRAAFDDRRAKASTEPAPAVTPAHEPADRLAA